MPPRSPGYKKYDAYPAPLTGDAEKAKSLLRARRLTPLPYCFRPVALRCEQTAGSVKENLKRAGFKIIMKRSTDATTTPTDRPSRTTDCDLITGGWGQDYPDGGTVLGVLIMAGSDASGRGQQQLSYFNETRQQGAAGWRPSPTVQGGRRLRRWTRRS